MIENQFTYVKDEDKIPVDVCQCEVKELGVEELENQSKVKTWSLGSIPVMTAADYRAYVINKQNNEVDLIGNLESIEWTEELHQIKGEMILGSYDTDGLTLAHMSIGQPYDLILIAINKMGNCASEGLHGLVVYKVTRGHSSTDLGNAVKAYFTVRSLQHLSPRANIDEIPIDAGQ